MPAYATLQTTISSEGELTGMSVAKQLMVTVVGGAVLLVAARVVEDYDGRREESTTIPTPQEAPVEASREPEAREASESSQWLWPANGVVTRSYSNGHRGVHMKPTDSDSNAVYAVWPGIVDSIVYRDRAL